MKHADSPTRTPEPGREAPSTITWKSYLLLSALGLAMALFVGSFQAFPGYMDADYYFAGGMQLAQGRGFNEPYIWNYLDDPAALPHPSHAYWMPLASVLSAFGMRLTGSTQYASGRLVFMALTALLPVVTARLALTFSRRAFPAIVSGLLSVFSIYYAPFLPVPDNYGVFMILGAFFMLATVSNRSWASLVMGMIAGAMTLARSDGVLWLLLGMAASLDQAGWTTRSPSDEASLKRLPMGPRGTKWLRLGLVVIGFLVLVTPWVVRNLNVYGAVRAPGAEKLAWLTTYDEIFSFPSDTLTPERWWNAGVPSLLAARVSALRWNLLNAVAAQGGVFLVPFILLGAWSYRRDPRVRLGTYGWVALLVAMTLVLPAVGARGGWFHAGAGFQAIWWSLAPLGLERVVASARNRGLFTAGAFNVFGAAMVCLSAVMTGYVLWIRVLSGWGEGEDKYPAVDRRLTAVGALDQDVAMVRNPPGYYMMTGRSAIVVPYADAEGIWEAAQAFGADYLVIEEAGATGPIRTVYDDLRGQHFQFIGEEDGSRLFRIKP